MAGNPASFPPLMPTRGRKPPDRSAARLIGLGTALPPLRVPQQEVLHFLLDHLKIRPVTRALYRRIFAHESVRTRHFSLTKLEDVLDMDLDRKNFRFAREAARLSVQSLGKALVRAGRPASAVDFIVAATCTGYRCPGLSTRIVADAGLRPDVQHADLVGMGCGAALPALQAAQDFCRAHPGALAAVVCTEICSAALYSDDAPDLVISNALFGDGSAAALLQSGGRSGPALLETASLVRPEWREGLRFRTEQGHLRNVLAPEVPARAALATRTLRDRLLRRRGLRVADVSRWILHPGGARVLTALAKGLGLSRESLGASWAVLERVGNLSSPSVLFALEESIRQRPPRSGEWAFLASFGAGFSAHGALIRFP